MANVGLTYFCLYPSILLFAAAAPLPMGNIPAHTGILIFPIIIRQMLLVTAQHLECLNFSLFPPKILMGYHQFFHSILERIGNCANLLIVTLYWYRAHKPFLMKRAQVRAALFFENIEEFWAFFENAGDKQYAKSATCAPKRERVILWFPYSKFWGKKFFANERCREPIIYLYNLVGGWWEERLARAEVLCYSLCQVCRSIGSVY